MTSGVDSVCHQHPSFFQSIADCLISHSIGDFGTLCRSEIATNQSAIQRGGRVFSSYTIPLEMVSCGDKLWSSPSQTGHLLQFCFQGSISAPFFENVFIKFTVKINIIIIIDYP